MMTDYHITQNSKRCTATGRELQPGEKYFSVLVEQDHKLVRQDYSQEAWQGPPAGAFSFWTGRISDTGGDSKPQIDDELLLDCFQRLDGENDPNKVNFRYVVALLLMRRKRLKFEEAKVKDGQEFLVLRCAGSKKKVEVLNPGLTEEEMLSVQDQVFQILGWQ
jgi:hypothetical protein